ncbi:MAG: TIGR02452 family protein [Phycisphaera sp. RhM]|nr:TIGR02452 family protein [Phycisphaera sp. RhM]
MAAARKQALDIAPEAAARLGWTAVEAARIGFDVNQAGEQIDWRGAVETARIAKTSITPDDPLPTPDEATFGVIEVQVTNETTLMAARRFVESGLERLVLNFANGVQPEGGFLYGARAQEEVLCRSSALFETLVDDPMYEHHWDRERPDSTGWVIHPPPQGVPVFRDDDDLLEFVDRQLFLFLTLFQLRHSLL